MSREDVINKTKKSAPYVIGIIVVLAMFAVFTTDTNKSRTAIDGMVVTDKVGKSYMLEYSTANRFKVIEFDIVNMRAKRD